MYSTIARFYSLEQFQQRWVARELSIRESFINPGQALVHHTTCSQVHVAYFGIPHLTLRKAYRQT
ncbi:hypothetical protein D3C77_803650 [compost metagenome]